MLPAWQRQTHRLDPGFDLACRDPARPGAPRVEKPSVVLRWGRHLHCQRPPAGRHPRNAPGPGRLPIERPQVDFSAIDKVARGVRTVGTCPAQCSLADNLIRNNQRGQSKLKRGTTNIQVPPRSFPCRGPWQYTVTPVGTSPWKVRPCLRPHRPGVFLPWVLP